MTENNLESEESVAFTGLSESQQMTVENPETCFLTEAPGSPSFTHRFHRSFTFSEGQFKAVRLKVKMHAQY